MEEFAKIFVSRKIGQIVVMKVIDDDGDPAIELCFRLNNRMAKVTLGYDFEIVRNQMFEDYTLDLAEDTLQPIIEAAD